MKNTANSLECQLCQQPIVQLVKGEDGEKIYCCHGCKAVDELLGGADFLDKNRLPTTQYLYLEEPKIKASLLDFQEENFARATLHLPEIHCSSCIYLLESLPDAEKGILDVQVQFAKKQATVTFQTDVFPFSKLAALLDFIGYKPDLQTKLGAQRKKRNTLLVKLGVAGFFFGNTMLLALPEYLDAQLSADENIQVFFRWLMVFFSLPVVFYSGRDYFINAHKSLRAGSLSIDLPIALGIFTLLFRSLFEVISGSGAGYFDSLTGLVFFLLLGKWYQKKTYENFTFDRDFRSFIPLSANLLLDENREKPVLVDDLKKGDKIIVRQGEVLPADAKLLSKKVLADYSYITGEAAPIEKVQNQNVFAGARIKGGAARFEITSTVDSSYLGSLWAGQSFAESHQKKSRTFTDKISQYFTPVVLFIALAAAVYWSFFDVSKAFTVFTAVLIVACPCALALAEPFANGSMMRVFGRHGFFLKNAEVLNRLQNISHLVFDKTGTLTKAGNTRVAWHGKLFSEEEKSDIVSIAKNAQHPLAAPLLEFLEIKNTEADKATNFTETTGEGVSAQVGSHFYKIGKAAFLKVEETGETTSVYVEKNGDVLGHFEFFQALRSEVKSLIQNFRNSKKITLLSGDNEAEKKRFQTLFGNDAELCFNQSPHDKLDYLLQLQKRGEKVAMIGDGLNDAGALQQSQVGISLCEKNVNFFPASDALLMADSLGKLDKFFKLSEQNKVVIYWAFAFSFLYNLVGLSFAVAGFLSPLVCAILMPLSSISVVIFVTAANRWRARRAL